MFVSLLSYSCSVYQFQKHNFQVSITSTDIFVYDMSVAMLPSGGPLFEVHCYLAAKCCKMFGFQEDVGEADTFMQNLLCPGSFRNRMCVPFKLNIWEGHVKRIKTARMKKLRKDSIQGMPDGLQSGISLLICHKRFQE